jgi:hypothetical protein
MKRILFKGQEYILTDDGAIADEADLKNFRASFAHYYPESDAVLRYGEQIGSSKDFKVLNDNVQNLHPGQDSLSGISDNAWFAAPKKV